MTTNPIPKRQLLLVSLCVLAIGGSVFWTYRTQFAAPKFNLVLHQAIGRVMAEETARLINDTGKIVLVAMELADAPELKAQLDSFRQTLKRFPRIAVKETYKLETDDKPKYSFGAGLSGRRFVRIVNKNLSADALVSFVGVPGLADDDLGQLKKSPKFIAEVRSAEKLKKLFEQKVIHTAVVSRFQFPTPIKGQPRSPQEWFEQRFQIVRADNAGDLPAGKEE